MATGFIYHRDFLTHDTGEGHPERPQRLTALNAHLTATGISDELMDLSVTPCPLKRIEAVHTTGHIERTLAASAIGPVNIDADTVVSRGSCDAAVLASGGACNACDAVIDGTVDNVFCAMRPPGHHAESACAMGFCLFNHVAVAARYLTRMRGIKRVLIIDWDVHHGNGTQEIFYDDPSVFYTSIHQSPFYPGTGNADERGDSIGKGFTLNIPLPPGSGDDEYRDAFETYLLPAALAFEPLFILISAGFDAHRDDPLAGMQVSEEGFAQLTEMVRDLADDTAEGRLVSVLEGGYDLDSLALSVEYHITALLD